MKGAGMFVVSLRGANFGFLSHLRCSGQNTIIFTVKVSFRVVHKKSLYFLFVCVLEWSLSGVKKTLGHVQIGLL